MVHLPTPDVNGLQRAAPGLDSAAELRSAPAPRIAVATAVTAANHLSAEPWSRAVGSGVP